jgi:hypothetical protein
MNLPLWLKRLGWPGLAGAVLIGGALWVERDWVPRQVAQTQTLESDARRLRHELQAKAEQQTKAEGQAKAGEVSLPQLKSPNEAWSKLWLALPDAKSRIALQKEVLQSAKLQGLSVSTVQYRGQMEPWMDKTLPQGLWRQRMTMPVEGSYMAVRAWLDRLLKQPALSVDALDIQRPDVMGEQVKAQVAVSLWWRQDRGH